MNVHAILSVVVSFYGTQSKKPICVLGFCLCCIEILHFINTGCFLFSWYGSKANFCLLITHLSVLPYDTIPHACAFRLQRVTLTGGLLSEILKSRDMVEEVAK